MTSIQPPRPPPNPKPFSLRGNSLQKLRQPDTYVDRTLHGDLALALNISQGFIEMAEERRLIIAIDYGTTFTGG